MITVIGATGNTGREITLRLLRDGHQVRALGRSAQKLAEVADAGAETRVGDVADPAFLTEAFHDADAAYAMLPTDPTWSDVRAEVGRFGEAIVAAARTSGIRHLVVLSSLGAELATDTGFITTLYDQEQRLATLDTNVLLLRPGLFFESFLPALEVIRHEGMNCDAAAPNVPVPMVAARDVAVVAASALAARDWQGTVVREVLGERDLTYAEVTAIIGARLGKTDLPYVQLPYADMAALLTSVGMSADAARLHVGMMRALNEQRIGPREGRSAANSTPTSFEEFADGLAAAYQV